MSELEKLKEKMEFHEAELVRLKTEKHNLKSKTQSTIDTLKDLATKIDELERSQKDIFVTDHAILRYLERIDGMDIEAIRKKIATEQVSKLIHQLGNGVFPVNDIFKITVNDKKITTVLLNEQKTSKSKSFSER